MKKVKQTTSVRLTPGAMRLLKKLANVMGVSLTVVIELSIRLMAEAKNIQDDGDDNVSTDK